MFFHFVRLADLRWRLPQGYGEQVVSLVMNLDVSCGLLLGLAIFWYHHSPSRKRAVISSDTSFSLDA